MKNQAFSQPIKVDVPQQTTQTSPPPIPYQSWQCHESLSYKSKAVSATDTAGLSAAGAEVARRTDSRRRPAGRGRSPAFEAGGYDQ